MPRYKRSARKGAAPCVPEEGSSSSSSPSPPPPVQKRRGNLPEEGPSRQPSRRPRTTHPSSQNNRWRNTAHEERFNSRFSKAKIVEGRIINWNRMAVDGYTGRLKEWLEAVNLFGLSELPESIFPLKIAEFYSNLLVRSDEVEAYMENYLCWFCDGEEHFINDDQLGELLGIAGAGSSNIAGGDRLREIWTELSGMPCIPKSDKGKTSAALLRNIDYRLLHHFVCSGLLSQPEGSYSTITQEEMLLVHSIASGEQINFARLIIHKIKAAARSEKGHMLYGRVISKILASRSDSSRWSSKKKEGIYTGTSLKKMDMERFGDGWRWKPTHIDHVKSFWRSALGRAGIPYSDRDVEIALGVRIMEAGEASGTAGAGGAEDVGAGAQGFEAEQREEVRHDTGRGTWINRKMKKVFGFMKTILANQKTIMEAQGLEFQAPQDESWTSSSSDA